MKKRDKVNKELFDKLFELIYFWVSCSGGDGGSTVYCANFDYKEVSDEFEKWIKQKEITEGYEKWYKKFGKEPYHKRFEPYNGLIFFADHEKSQSSFHFEYFNENDYLEIPPTCIGDIDIMI